MATPDKRSLPPSGTFRVPASKWVRKIFQPSRLAQLVREVFSRRPSQPSRGGDESRPLRRQSFTLEALEPRLLLSADLSYAAASSAHEFTVKATQDSGNYYLSLFDSSDLLTSIADKQVVGSDVTVSVGRDDTLSARALNSDTVHLDLDSFSLLDAIMAGHTLGIDMQGGDQRLFQDLMTVDGTTGAVGYSLSLTANSQVSSSATASITGNFSITSEQAGISGVGAKKLQAYGSDILRVLAEAAAPTPSAALAR